MFYYGPSAYSNDRNDSDPSLNNTLHASGWLSTYQKLFNFVKPTQPGYGEGN